MIATDLFASASWSTITSVAGMPSGRSPLSISALSFWIRSESTPSNSTTRASAIETLLRGQGEPKVPAPVRRYLPWARPRKGREFARRALPFRLLCYLSATTVRAVFEVGASRPFCVRRGGFSTVATTPLQKERELQREIARSVESALPGVEVLALELTG